MAWAADDVAAARVSRSAESAPLQRMKPVGRDRLIWSTPRASPRVLHDPPGRDQGPNAGYFPQVAKRPMAAAAMAAVASQPTAFRPECSLKSPMAARWLERCIMSAMTGTATTPLITALQNSALIGSIGLKLSRTPSRVATAMAP